MDITKTVSKKIAGSIKNNLKSEFENAVTKIKQIIIEEYNDKLIGGKDDSKSGIDYNKYNEEFIVRLNRFQFIKDNDNGIILDIPDMETFNFSDGLEIVKTIMEGLSGTYVEVNEKEYLYIFGRKPNPIYAVDKNVTASDMVFLIAYRGKIPVVEKELNKRFVKYKFSNTQPIDVFEKSNSFVKANLDKWINNAIEKSNKEVVSSYK